MILWNNFKFVKPHVYNKAYLTCNVDNELVISNYLENDSFYETSKVILWAEVPNNVKDLTIDEIMLSINKFLHNEQTI